MEHVIDDCTCQGRRCAMCEETKCYGRFKALTTFNCIGCQKAYQKGYQKAYERRSDKDKPVVAIPRDRPKGRHSSAEYNAKWRKEHPEEWKAWYLRYKEKHPSSPERRAIDNANYRARQLGIEGVITLQEWIELKARYNNVCLCCGSADVKLCIDHIVSLDKGGSNFIDNIQPLCMPCNSRKRDKTIDFRPQNT